MQGPQESCQVVSPLVGTPGQIKSPYLCWAATPHPTPPHPSLAAVPGILQRGQEGRITMACSSTSRPIVIVGGSGKIGQLIIEHLKRVDTPLVIMDKRQPPSPEVPFVAGDVTSLEEHSASLLQGAKTVILAVPGCVAVNSIEQVSPLLVEDDNLLIEACSVKSRMRDALIKHAPNLQAAGIHPLFAPSAAAHGKDMIVVAYRGGAELRSFLKGMQKWGLKIHNMNADEHDRAMATAQVITHTSILAYGLALHEFNKNEKGADLIATPPCEVYLALLARICSGIPETYWEIQASNPYGKRARQELASAVERINSIIDEGGGVDEFAALTRRAANILGEKERRYAALCANLFQNLPYM